jgi:hypothetical protein
MSLFLDIGGRVLWLYLQNSHTSIYENLELVAKVKETMVGFTEQLEMAFSSTAKPSVLIAAAIQGRTVRRTNLRLKTFMRALNIRVSSAPILARLSTRRKGRPLKSD